jgi:DNA-binding transcriptional LysR family regulator
MQAADRKAEELLGSYPFIRYTRQAWVGQIIDRFLRERRLRVNESMTLDTLEAITTMVHHGLGVSIVPRRTGGDPLALPVRVLAFSGAPSFRVLGLVHEPNHPKAALAEALLLELKALVSQAAAIGDIRRPGRASASGPERENN